MNYFFVELVDSIVNAFLKGGEARVRVICLGLFLTGMIVKAVTS